jgi:hypothetical protein
MILSPPYGSARIFKTGKTFFYHPLLLGVYPVLALLAYNLTKTSPLLAVRSLILSALGAAFLYWILDRVVHNTLKAALLPSLILFLFFTYGHVYDLMIGQFQAGLIISCHRYLILIWGMVLGVAAWFVLRRLKDPLTLNRFLNTAALFLVIMPLMQMGIFEIRMLSEKKQAKGLRSMQILF